MSYGITHAYNVSSPDIGCFALVLYRGASSRSDWAAKCLVLHTKHAAKIRILFETWKKKKKKCKKRDSFCKDIRGNREKGTGKQGARRHVTGRDTASCQIRAGARMNWGGRPYILERPPWYAGAVGRTRILFLRTNLFRQSYVDDISILDCKVTKKRV